MIDAVLDTLYCVFVFNPYSAEIDLDVRIWRLKKRRAHVKLYQLSSLHFQILTYNFRSPHCKNKNIYNGLDP